MSIRSSRAGVEEEFFDPGDRLPAADPVTVAQAAAAEAVAAEQLALLNAAAADGVDGVDVPGSPAAEAAWADIVATLEADLLDPGRLGWAPEVLSSCLSQAGTALDVATGLEDGDLTRLMDEAVRDAVQEAGRLSTRTERLTYALAVQVHARGLHTGVGLSLVDWVRARCPFMSLQQGSALKQVVEAGTHHWGAPLDRAVREGRTSLARAGRVARVMLRLRRALDPDQAEAYAQIATGAACSTKISDADLGKVCTRLLTDLLDEDPDRGEDPDDRTGPEPARQALRCVTRTPLGEGMVRYTVDAPVEDAPMFDGILFGPLATPVPRPEGEKDSRDAGQRQYDAVKTVVSRGLANPGAPASSARASVILTVKADPRTGRPTGTAESATGGTWFTSTAAGRYACMGDLTPVVLGEMGEPLDLGRTQRLASPGQFKALLVRDKHCTYPGCTIPGTWCEVHHLIWWCRHGDTDIVLLVLLCPRHHTVVHTEDLMATVVGDVVTWHL
ncbi:HNH endonuclease signature motif containing protein [Ornithinimicrobium avium]|uniref:HNH endonuclease n=1 Tax=Ornithinimicrobium avium TaxID=2283195 RepID=A0A345NM61_9MICO|nr:HNH endonuclease signature motif containing protein [Ornithinimicrobium avium]AXH96119.1 HNH endonuclease [Ornithinimicrobium avium]